jgi:hypothetical protein
VFTKYDQFLRNVGMDMFDEPGKYPEGDVYQVAEKRFQDHYLHLLGADVKYVRLESESKVIYERQMLMFFRRDANDQQPL